MRLEELHCVQQQTGRFDEFVDGFCIGQPKLLR
jgi:hypothetical protein